VSYVIPPTVTMVNDYGNVRDAEKVEHPAFGQIRASRVTGKTNLYGSDFLHHSFINITIARSEYTRNLSHDWRHAREELITVALSEAQWATFISTLNVGEGTPCTLERVMGKAIPGIDSVRDAVSSFRSESRKQLEEANARLDGLRDMIKSMNVPSKVRQQLLIQCDTVGYGIGDNLDFVEKSFGEHIETVVESAKVEVEAYITGTLQRAGVAALAGKPIELLPSPARGRAQGGCAMSSFFLSPEPLEIRKARISAGLGQAEASELVYLGSASRWSDYERGVVPMDPARWELFLLRVGRHPQLRLARRRVPLRAP